MALQSFMNELVEELGAEAVIVVNDEVMNHCLNKRRSSIRRSQQLSNSQSEQRDYTTSPETASPEPTQLRRDSSDSFQPSLVSMNDSPNRGQFRYQKRASEEVLSEINYLPLEEQRDSRPISPLKRKKCIYVPQR